MLIGAEYGNAGGRNDQEWFKSMGAGGSSGGPTFWRFGRVAHARSASTTPTGPIGQVSTNSKNAEGLAWPPLLGRTAFPQGLVREIISVGLQTIPQTFERRLRGIDSQGVEAWQRSPVAVLKETPEGPGVSRAAKTHLPYRRVV